MAAIIRAENLTHIYGQGMPDAATAIENLNFEIEENSYIPY